MAGYDGLPGLSRGLYGNPDEIGPSQTGLVQRLLRDIRCPCPADKSRNFIRQHIFYFLVRFVLGAAAFLAAGLFLLRSHSGFLFYMQEQMPSRPSSEARAAARRVAPSLIKSE